VMNYVQMISEENGYCPKCSSGDTVSIRVKVKRVCLSCEFTEEFDSYNAWIWAWQKRPNNEFDRSHSLVRKQVNPAGNLDLPTRRKKQIEKIIESIEPEITKVTIPTQYREDFSQYLVSRNIELFRSAKTDVWNGIESAYTDFELRVKSSLATLIVEDWLLADDLIVSA